MEPEVLYTSSQQEVIWPYLELDESSPHRTIQFL